jgi:hypothetical protein
VAVRTLWPFEAYQRTSTAFLQPHHERLQQIAGLFASFTAFVRFVCLQSFTQPRTALSD